jgi:flagellar hook-associated protein 1 FlgK
VSATKTTVSLTSGTTELPFFLDASTPYTAAISSFGPQGLGFAGRITVNAALLADPAKLVTYQASTASGDPTRPNFIFDQLNSAPVTFSPRSGVGTSVAPFSGPVPAFMRQIISQQGQAAEDAMSLKQGQEVVLNALRQRFNESASVNIDKEMANLLSLQNAYAANARVMSTVKEMLDALMKM